MPQQLNDLTGQRFDQLLVIERDFSKSRKNSHWKCRCDCGNEIISKGIDLKNGRTKSCGCLKKENMRLLGENSIKHGHSCLQNGKQVVSRTYTTWQQMIQRCTNPKLRNFKYYGGRGISVCESWKRDFMSFLRDMGPKPPGMTLDRKNNDGNYEPGNCRWVDAKTQAKNRRERKRDPKGRFTSEAIV